MKAKDFRKKAWESCKGNWGNLILVLVINFALLVYNKKSQNTNNNSINLILWFIE